ncbi:MAG: hypothetical protein K0R39_4840 [Symbiobacteriaceae bacterium]|jgi:anti-sigma factor RsiW|nr:hypothetical protein [Symbiobacteriaceae bacterium]
MELDEALATGTLALPAELALHADGCPRCGPEYRDTEALLSRLRGAAAGIELGPVPQAVDKVLDQITREAAPRVFSMVEASAGSPGAQHRQKQVRTRWILGQVAAVAAVLLIAVGGIGYAILKVNEAVSGVSPGDVLAKFASPFRFTDTAKIEKAK